MSSPKSVAIAIVGVVSIVAGITVLSCCGLAILSQPNATRSESSANSTVAVKHPSREPVIKPAATLKATDPEPSIQPRAEIPLLAADVGDDPTEPDYYYSPSLFLKRPASTTGAPVLTWCSIAKSAEQLADAGESEHVYNPVLFLRRPSLANLGKEPVVTVLPASAGQVASSIAPKNTLPPSAMSMPSTSGGRVQVSGYFNKAGHYVQPYTRSAPGRGRGK